MSQPSDTLSPSKRGPLISAALAILVLGAIALDTTVVSIGSEQDVRAAKVLARGLWGRDLPKVQATVTQRAVDAVELATAIASDPKAAEAKYSVGGVYPVKFEGVVGEGKSRHLLY